MSRLRVSVSVLVLALLCAAPVVAQNRSNFTGKWTLLPEKSVPPNPNGPATTFTISQEGQKFTIAPVGVAGSESVLNTYVTDGEEHSTTVRAAAPARLATYRAVWTRDQLAITFNTQVPDASGDPKNARTITTRQVYSIDAEGFLIIEASVVGSSASMRSTPSRSVYRKG